jgi:hypothetical protein
MNREIVASAVTSFNNAALVMPNFMWSAVLMLPIFLIVWNFSDEILVRLFPSKKNREYNFIFISEILLFVWLVFSHGNWSAIRDGVGFLPYLNAMVVFLLTRDIVCRLIERNPKMPSFWQRFNIKEKKWIKLGALLVGVAIIRSSASDDFNFQALQICSVLFGIAAGYARRHSSLSINYMNLIMLMLVVAITMQPEYFRFGQLGHLSIIHSLFLVGILACAASILVIRNVASSDFIKDNHYRYIKWFMRLATLLAFILFIITESVPVLLGLGVSIMMTMWFAVRHLPSGTSVFNMSNNLFAIIMGMFGVVTGIHVITIIGVLFWKNAGIRNFLKNFIAVIK